MHRKITAVCVLAASVVGSSPGKLVAAPTPRAAKPAPKPAAAPPAEPERITAVEGLTEYRLRNGLRVLLFPDASKPTITVNITYQVGSRHENYGETGMAHLLEHMVFKGTPKHPDIPKELTEHGARPNGTTSQDRTNYYETFAATEDNLRWALDLEADRMVHSYVAKKDLDTEMTVVRNEFESGENSPSRVLYQRMHSAAYLWHSYGKSTIGARSDIENVPIDRLQAFYRMYYQPDNAVLLVAGKFDEPKTLALVNSYFAAIPQPSRTLPKIYTTEPTQDGERMVTLRRVGDVPEVSALYHVPAATHPDFAAIELLVQVLASEPSGRLYKALVETKKASSISGGGQPLHDPGTVIFSAEVPREKSLDAARDTLLQTIEGQAATAVTPAEVERARGHLLKGIELTLTDSTSLGLQLSNWIARGDWRLFFFHRDELRKVTAEDIKRVAAAYLKPANRTLGMFIPTAQPERAAIPAAPEVATLLKDYKGDPTVTAGEVFDPSPENIEARTQRTSLPGGLQLALLPKQTRGQMVNVGLALRFGDEKSLFNREVAAELLGSMLMRGTTKHTRQQLKDEFDRLRAQVGLGGGPARASANIHVPRANLMATLRLVAEVLREPAFPVNEFELLVQERLTSLEEARSLPEVVAGITYSSHLSPYPRGDVRHVSTIDEQVADIKKTTLADAKKFYADFYGASDAQLSAVGDFDAGELTKLVTELFGSWKSPRPFVRVPIEYKEVAPLNQSLNTPDKTNAVLRAGLNLRLRDDDPDYPALVLSNYMLGGGFLSSRFATRIRQKEGISYGINSSFTASALDVKGSFVAAAIYAPQNVGRLEAALREELTRALADGFTAAEITSAKSGYRQSQQVFRSNDGALVGRLQDYLFWHRTFVWDTALEQKIAALTPEQLVAAMRKHLDPAKLTVVKAGDFAKTAK